MRLCVICACIATAAAKPDNIVLILSDDQDAEFNGLEPMTQARALLGERGVTARHNFVNTPICCPSRAETLTGRYAHNLRDATYEPFPSEEGFPDERGCGDEPVESPFVGSCGCMRMNCSAMIDKPTYATALQAVGYTTAYFGKYLNPPAMVRFCRNETLGPLEHGWPAGWDIFYGMCDQASTPEGGYYDMNWVDSEAGAVTFTGKEPEDYTTSIVGNKTLNFLRAHHHLLPDNPFMVAAAVRAPHAPYLPASWYKDHVFPGGRAAVPRTPAYNASTAGTGKPAWYELNGPISAAEADKFEQIFSDRWRALLSVDDLVAGVVAALDEFGFLERTWIFYTSDNGYHFGHFRLPAAKMHVFEFDTRVPLLIRHPSVCANSSLAEIVGNVDLAPTFLVIANASLLAPMDGNSLLPLLQRPCAAPFASDGWRTEYPIECLQRESNPQSPDLARATRRLHSRAGTSLFPTGRRRCTRRRAAWTTRPTTHSEPYGSSTRRTRYFSPSRPKSPTGTLIARTSTSCMI